MDPVLTVQNLSKSYTRGFMALDRIDLLLPPGRIVGLLGPNGSGKTTLLKLIAGLLTPTVGQIQVCGYPIGRETRSLVSYLPDRTYLRNSWTVRQQLTMFEDFYADFDRTRAEQMLYTLGVPLEAKLGSLSKGTKEKVQLILAMSRRARLYLLDEPIGGVDPATRDYILRTIVGNFDSQATVILSTHLIADAESILDDYIFLNRGQIVRMGNAADTRNKEGRSLDELFREVFRCLPNC